MNGVEVCKQSKSYWCSREFLIKLRIEVDTENCRKSHLQHLISHSSREFTTKHFRGI